VTKDNKDQEDCLVKAFGKIMPDKQEKNFLQQTATLTSPIWSNIASNAKIKKGNSI